MLLCNSLRGPLAKELETSAVVLRGRKGGMHLPPDVSVKTRLDSLQFIAKDVKK